MRVSYDAANLQGYKLQGPNPSHYVAQSTRFSRDGNSGLHDLGCPGIPRIAALPLAEPARTLLATRLDSGPLPVCLTATQRDSQLKILLIV